MPFDSEALAKKFGESADDVKKSLEGMIGAAEDVDRVFAKMTERQESAMQVMEKFDKALAASSKGITGFGRSGLTAARGLKTIDAVSRSAASSLGAVGAGAAAAASGFKTMSAEAASFSSDISNAERNVAGLVTGIGGLESKLKGISTSSVPINVVVGSLKSLEDLEQRISALPKDVTVNVSMPGTKVLKTPTTLPAAIANTPISAGAVGGPKAGIKASKKTGAAIGKSLALSFVDKVGKELRRAVSSGKDELAILEDSLSTVDQKKKYIELAVKIAGEEELRQFIEDMEEADAKIFKKDVKKMGMEEAINRLIERAPILGLRMKKAAAEAKDAAEEMTSQLKKLEDQMSKEAKTLGDLFGKQFAAGGVEAAKFADGLGANATGMMAVGLAGAFLVQKLGDLAGKFADAAVGLAKYKTETAALEHTIVGITKGGLEQMRKQLSLTREQASQFFDVVKQGMNELGMSQTQILRISKALQETFGGDQTDRLREYVDLLKTIPTIETDLSITANMDDQAAAIFGLAQAGKMDVVMDLQTAGLLGGEQKKAPGADMANAAQKTAAASEGIKDFLLNKMYPEWGNYLSEGVKWLSSGVGATFSVVGAVGALKFFMGAMHGKTMIQIQSAATQISTAIATQGGGIPGGPPKLPGGGGGGGGGLFGRLGGLWKTIPKLTKGLGAVALVSMAAEAGLDYFSDKLAKGGNKVGSAAASLGSSVAAIAGYAAAGAALGSVIPVIGTAAGALIGAVWGIISEFSDLKKSIPTLFKAYFGKRDAIGSEELLAGEATLANQQMKLVKSGLALQRSLNLIKATFGSARYELYRMEKEFAKVKLDNLSQMGGSAEAFSGTIRTATATTRKMYDMQLSDSASLRRKIMADASMTAEARRQALMVIHDAELKATKDFIDGMNDLIDALFASPQIIQAGLKAQIAQVTIGFAEGGGMGKKEIAATQAGILDNLEAKLRGVGEAAAASTEASARKIAALNTKRAMKEQEINQTIEEGIARKGVANDEELKDAAQRLAAAKMARIKSEQEGPSKVGVVGRSATSAAAGAIMPGGGAVTPLLEKLENEKRRKDYEERIAREDAQIAALSGEVMAKKQRYLAKEEQIRMLEEATVAEMDSQGKVVSRKVDTGKARDVLREVAARQEQVDTEMEQARQEIANNFGISTSRSAQVVSKQLEGAKKEAKKASEDYEEALSSGEGLSEAKKAKEEAEKAVAELQDQLDDIVGEVAKQIRSLAPDMDPAKAKEIAAKMAGVKGGLGEMEKELAGVKGLSEAMRASIAKSTLALQRRGALEEEAGKLGETKDMLESVLDAETGVNSVLADSLKSTEEISRAAHEWVDALGQTWQVFDDTIYEQQRIVDAARRSAAMGRMVGDGIESSAKSAEQETALIRKQIDSYEASAAEIRRRGKKAAEELVVLKQNEETAKKAAAAVADMQDDSAVKIEAKRAEEVATTRRQAAEMMVAATEEESNKAENAAQEVRERLGIAGDQIESALQNLAKSASGARLANLDELASVTADAADYFGDVTTAGRESFAIAKKVAQERLAYEREALEKGLEQDKKRNEERIKEAVDAARREAEAQGKVASKEDLDAVAAKTRQEVEATTESKRRVEMAKMEVKAKKAVVEAAKRSKELKESELDIQQGLLDDAMSFASEFGGSFSSIMEMQQMNVGMARQQLELAKQYHAELVAEGVEGLELQRAQADVIRQQLNVRRKELGVQKDMMDRLLGGVFGELRKDFGARRGRGTDQALMGIAATRMKTASGLFINVPGGAPGTLQERANQRMLGNGGPQGALPEGPLGDAMRVLRKAPTKAPIEQKLADALGDTDKNTKKTAEATGNLDAAATSRGSLFTHDEGAQGILGGILSVLKELTVGMLGGVLGAKAGDPKAVEQKLDGLISTAKQLSDAGAAKNEKMIAGLADTAKKTEGNTAKANVNLTEASATARKELQESMAALRTAKKGSDEQKAAAEKVAAGIDKLAGLESAIRVREIQNPYAGAAPGIVDYERVMAGKLPKEAAEFSQIMGEGTKEATKTAAQGAKERKATGKAAVTAARYLSGGKFDPGARTLQGGKFDPFSRTLGSTDSRWAAMTKLGETPAGGKRMESKGMMAGSTINATKAAGTGTTAGGVRAFGGATPLGGTTATATPGGAVGMGVSKSGFPALGGSASMAGKAGGLQTAPPSTGQQAANAGVAGAGGASAGGESTSIRVTGEMMVKFDNKMLKDTLTPVVLQIMDTNKVRLQQMVFSS